MLLSVGASLLFSISQEPNIHSRTGREAELNAGY